MRKVGQLPFHVHIVPIVEENALLQQLIIYDSHDLHVPNESLLICQLIAMCTKYSACRKERRQFRCPFFLICRLRTTFEGLDYKQQIGEETHIDQWALNLSKSDQYTWRNEALKLD